jgi:hypothetical protein
MMDLCLMHEAHYRILDLSVSLSSDSRELLSRFDADYGWFRIPSPDRGKGLAFSVRLKNGRGPSFQMIRRGGCHASASLSAEKQSLVGNPGPVDWSLQQIINAIFLETEDFMVLHAGVLENYGSAVILAGPPGCGKTTLVLELLKKGFRFMSDDGCPVHKSTGKVYPFPRRPWVVRSDEGINPSSPDKKTPFAIDHIKFPVYRSPCAMGWLFCLDVNCDSNEHEMHMGLRQGSGKALLNALTSLPGVRVGALIWGNRGIQIRYPRNQGLTSKVRSLLREDRTAAWSVYRWDRVRPDFHHRPKLEAIASHEAAFHLMRHTKTDSLNGKTGQATAILWECALLLKSVPTWRLQVGDLKETVSLIVETVQAP